MPVSSQADGIFIYAEGYFSLGYSVIPLHGDADPARPKVAAVPWAAYQKSRASLNQLRQWFLEDQFPALGIVTGSVSRLIVLDFDSPDLFNNFKAKFPALVERQVVQTRRGFHIYFALPPNLQINSRKLNGIDLLANGSYVVGRPTSINGHEYKLVKGGAPQVLSLENLHRINQFLDEEGKFPVSSSQFPVKTQDSGERDVRRSNEGAYKAISERDISRPYENSAPVLGGRDMSRLYGDELPLAPPLHPMERGLGGEVLPQHFYTAALAKNAGRNNALFQASRAARDNGWPLDQTLDQLIPLHINQRQPLNHLPETPNLRRQEAVNTICSAYSRPPNPRYIKKKASYGLPNTVREKLFALKRTDVVRVWEGLHHKGLQPGTIFTAVDAVQLLKGIVGRDSVYNALNAEGEGGQPLFGAQPPSELPRASSDAAADTNRKTPTKCSLGRGKKSGINQKGPKTRLFVMPAPLDWCTLLGVRGAPSDPLNLEDLASAKNTRMAAHRELIKRRPGIYPRRWLANRLGVNIKTIDTYNHDIPIFSRPQFIETRICWSNLKQIPDGLDIMGTFLEDETGKRYPAIRPIAVKLLHAGKSVTYKRQDANYYWYGERPPDISILYTPHAKRAEHEATLERIRQFIAEHPIDETGGTRGIIPLASTSHKSTAQLPMFSQPKHRTAARQTKEKKPNIVNGRRALKDSRLENLACNIQLRVNGRSSDSALHMSISTARKLACRYDRKLIDYALNLLDKRHSLSKPAGFFVTVLRSESKRSL